MDGKKMTFEIEIDCDECTNTIESGDVIYCKGCYEILIAEYETLEYKLENEVVEKDEKISELETEIDELKSKINELESGQNG